MNLNPDSCVLQAPLAEVESYAEYRVMVNLVLAAIKNKVLKARQLANLAWALAALGAVTETEALDGIFAACIELNMTEFKEQELTNVIWALATVGEWSKPCSSCASSLRRSRRNLNAIRRTAYNPS